MSKFKKGDIVRITVKERQPGWDLVGKMDRYIGMLVEVDGVTCGGRLFNVLRDKCDNEHDQWAFKTEEAELVYRPSDSDDRYEDGLNDAWEAAQRIVLRTSDGGCSSKDLENMFGDKTYDEVLMEYSPKEVIKTIADYKQKDKDEEASKRLQDLIDRFGTDTICAIAKDMAKENEKRIENA